MLVELIGRNPQSKLKDDLNKLFPNCENGDKFLGQLIAFNCVQLSMKAHSVSHPFYGQNLFRELFYRNNQLIFTEKDCQACETLIIQAINFNIDISFTPINFCFVLGDEFNIPEEVVLKALEFTNLLFDCKLSLYELISVMLISNSFR